MLPVTPAILQRVAQDTPSFALPEPCILVAGELTLRPWIAEDVATLELIADDPQIATWNPLRKPDDTIAAWVLRRGIWDDHMSWAVVTASDDLAGSVSIFQFDNASANAQIGYWTAPDHRGQGIAGRAVQRAIDAAFEMLPLERMSLFHAVSNAASCRVADKAGFTLEGTTRKSWRYPDGQLHDEHVHGRLRSDRD